MIGPFIVSVAPTGIVTVEPWFTLIPPIMVDPTGSVRQFDCGHKQEFILTVSVVDGRFAGYQLDVVFQDPLVPPSQM